MDLNSLGSMSKAELADWIRQQPARARRSQHELYRLRCRVARSDPNEFIELVLKDEESGGPVQQAPLHEEFQKLATDHDRSVIWSHVESAKTSNISIGRALYEIGRNPRIRIVIAAHTVGHAEKIVSAIKRYIESPGPYHDVFPNLRKGSLWTRTQLKVSIIGKMEPKDPTVRATAVNIASVQGARIDLLILDDVVTWENSSTEAGREKIWQWYNSILVGRLSPKARVLVVGTAFHPDDLMHRLSKLPEWYSKRFSVLKANGQPTWPERWSLKRINRRRGELTPAEFARQMLSIPRDDAESRFNKAWIEQCIARGEGRSPAYSLDQIPPGFKILTGVDLGARSKGKGDLTVLFTIAVHPNGDREVLWVESGRWAGPDIVTRVIDTHRRYGSIVFVENNAAQQFILDFTKERSAVPVLPFTTGNNKNHPEFGIESIAAEMANGKWIIPSRNGIPATPEMSAWVAEMISYDPNAHTGDRLMASWFAREGSRTPGKKRARQQRLNTLRR